MNSIDDDWASFLDNDINNNTASEDSESKNSSNNDFTDNFIPKCTPIYISTQTKIAHLNQPIELNDIYWQLPIIKYQERREGIIKTQMKVNSLNKSDVVELEKKIKNCKNIINVDIIHNVDNPNARRIVFKDVRKINIGICKKDLTSYRTKKKGAFYNCFVLILRLKEDEIFKEFHIKVFNTGKLELPGIKNSKILDRVLNKLIDILSPFVKKPLSYKKNDIKTVLINSNFSCNYFIDREKLSNIIKYKYNLHVVYDPCSYPGIQCKFYYNNSYEKNTGICECKDKCYNKKSKIDGCMEVSFMVFRTGSVLIVGKCCEKTLNFVYEFIKTILMNEYQSFIINEQKPVKKEKVKKNWKKTILIG